MTGTLYVIALTLFWGGVAAGIAAGIVNCFSGATSLTSFQTAKTRLQRNDVRLSITAFVGILIGGFLYLWYRTLL